ncbi:hypothetical protein GCAAIG_12585 [Candidatus Electronema halotolerans]
METELIQFAADLLQHLTFARLTLLAGLLLFMSAAFNADKIAELINAIAKLLRRNDA